MRKLICLLLIMLIIFTFCSCKNNDNENNSSGVTSTITTNADSSLISSLETTTSTEPTEDKKKPTESATSENKGTTEQTDNKEPVTSVTPVTQTPKTDNSEPCESKAETTTSTPTTTTPTTETPPTTTTVPTYTRPTGAEVSERVAEYINGASLTVLLNRIIKNANLIIPSAQTIKPDSIEVAKYKEDINTELGRQIPSEEFIITRILDIANRRYAESNSKQMITAHIVKKRISLMKPQEEFNCAYFSDLVSYITLDDSGKVTLHTKTETEIQGEDENGG